jgi:predicted transcriptional regulator
MATHHPTTPKTRTPVTLRVPDAIAAEVRQIAERDDLTQGAVLRRLVRRGLEAERRSHDGNEAA